MAKFKELQLGQQVRLVSSKHTDAAHGYMSKLMLEVGAVGTITDLHTTNKAVRLDGQIYVYHHKDLEIVAEVAPESVRTEPVTTAKDVPVGTKVRIRDFRNNTYERSYSSRIYPTKMDKTIGTVGVVTMVDDGVHVAFEDGLGWFYCYDFVEPVVEQPVLTTESSTLKVDASTPIGTKVRVLQGERYGCYKAGAVGTLSCHAGDNFPRVDFLDDYWFAHYDNLEIVSQDTPCTVCGTDLEFEPVSEPKELTLADFVVTRVRVKDTGAKGTVIGHTDTDYVGVQHDVDVKGTFHRCSPQLGEAEGATGRCYWYLPDDLEIITEEV